MADFVFLARATGARLISADLWHFAYEGCLLPLPLSLASLLLTFRCGLFAARERRDILVLEIHTGSCRLFLALALYRIG